MRSEETVRNAARDIRKRGNNEAELNEQNLAYLRALDWVLEE